MTRIAVAILVLLTIFSTATTAVFADPTDTGTIQVFGTVQPQPTSIITNLSATPISQTVNQNQVITYTFSYSSTNAGTVPLSLQAEWQQGTVAGASEASVNAVSYVLGSASNAYGSTPAVVDTLNRRISWTITALPSSAGTQTVSFQLLTTSNYTGPLEVTVPVVAKVLSPAGVSDKTVAFTYAYLAPTTSSTSTTQTVSPTPSASGSPSPTISAQATPVPTRSLRSVAITAIGKTSAKISIKAELPAAVKVVYGTSPSNLESSIETDSIRTDHSVFITNLKPKTKYFFSVSAVGESQNQPSDIFTFTTAADTDLGVLRKPEVMTLSQKRAVLYSGVTPDLSEVIVPLLAVAKNTVVDVNLTIPDGDEVLSVEVEVRSAYVLGESTAKVTSDDFQSLSTTLTRISEDVYVGKVRTPVTPGRYQLISRIEDIYGNLSEDEIGSMLVTAPMMITSSRNAKPIEHAEVTLYVFNQQTRLYDLLSNVTTSIDNPSYSDLNGVVDLHLHQAKYKAEVIAAGFKPQTVEFEIGSSEVQSFPQIELEPSGGPIAGSIGQVSRQFRKEWKAILSHIQYMSGSLNFYNMVLFLDVSAILISSVYLWTRKSWTIQPWSVVRHKLGRWFPYFEFGVSELAKSIVNFFLATSFWFSYFFIGSLGWGRGLLIVALTSMAFCLWMKALWQMRKSAKKLHSQS